MQPSTAILGGDLPFFENVLRQNSLDGHHGFFFSLDIPLDRVPHLYTTTCVST